MKDTACHLHIENMDEAPYAMTQPLHPKNKELGSKPIIYSNHIILEYDDAATIAPGLFFIHKKGLILDEKVTLMKLGNCIITKIEKDPENEKKITLFGKLDLEDQDMKKTKKLHWLAFHLETVLSFI
jgi:hypothetical protein